MFQRKDSQIDLWWTDRMIDALADLGGAWGTHAPPGRPNSFDFMQFSGKFGVFTPPLEGSRPPPRENPGSATEMDRQPDRHTNSVDLLSKFEVLTIDRNGTLFCLRDLHGTHTSSRNSITTPDDFSDNFNDTSALKKIWLWLYCGAYLPPANEVAGRLCFYRCVWFCSRVGGVSQDALQVTWPTSTI